MKKEAVIKAENNFVPSARHESSREEEVTFMQPLFLISLFKKLILPVMLVVTQSCRQHQDSQSLSAVSDTVFFDVGSPGGPVKILKCEAVLSEQRVQLDVHLPTAAPQSMDQLASWELVTVNGNRSIPSKINVDLPRGNAKLIYEPVHSLELFQRTGLRGDIEPEYALHLTPLENGGKKVTLNLTIPPEIYQESLKVFGLASNTTPYVLSLDDQFVDEQKNHLRNSLVSEPARSEGTVHATENEVLIGGLWLKIQSHHQRDTFYADVRIVNQFQSAINFDLNAITLSSGDTVTRQNLAGDHTLEIPNGGRARINLKFNCVSADIYRLDFSALTFPHKGKNLPVFLNPVVLKATTLFQAPLAR